MFSSSIPVLCHEDKPDKACEYFQRDVKCGYQNTSSFICLALKQAIPDEGRKYKVADSAVKMDRLRNTQLTIMSCVGLQKKKNLLKNTPSVPKVRFARVYSCFIQIDFLNF